MSYQFLAIKLVSQLIEIFITMSDIGHPSYSFYPKWVQASNTQILSKTEEHDDM